MEEKIAITGLSCAFAGDLDGPGAYWSAMMRGAVCVTDLPAERGWDIERLYSKDKSARGTTYSKRGGFMRDADRFDPDVFGIAPREAIAMDPQQRKALEYAWQALESSGRSPLALKGSRTGVFLGCHNYGYSASSECTGSDYEGYLLTGSATSVVSGRIAYCLGLEGPALTIDTACSSSLVAMHLARQSLLRHECDLAIAGGVAIISRPSILVEFARQGGLSMDGTCKPFSTEADGIGLAEGVAFIVLERLVDAWKARRRVRAVVVGSAVNQDGASNGLTAPNGPSQERVIRAALQDAGVSPLDVDVVEAHGTGTKLGDPIEGRALVRVYGRGAGGPSLAVGSAKGNIGHTQAAAGAAGVIKLVLSLEAAMLPPSGNLSEPTDLVEWKKHGAMIPREPCPWPPGTGVRRAGVSAFGISGTNSHAVLEEAPPPPRAILPAVDGLVNDRVPLVLSAHSVDALSQMAADFSAVLESAAAPDLLSLARASAAVRSRGRYGLVCTARDGEHAAQSLRAFADGAATADSICWGTRRPVPLAGLVFSGQGSRIWAVGRQLIQSVPRFRADMLEVLDEMDRYTSQSLVALISGDQGLQDLVDTAVIQPLVFAVGVSLARLLDAVGVTPRVVLGHSLGEITAAHVAGVFDLPDACRFVASRALAMSKAPLGGMLAVRTGYDPVRRLILERRLAVEIAAVNSPTQVVVAGSRGDIQRAQAVLAGDGIGSTVLHTRHAFHTSAMREAAHKIHAVLETLVFCEPRIPILSNEDGEVLDVGRATSADYWARHILRSVHWDACVRRALDLGVDTFVELGPHPVLAPAIEEVIDDAAVGRDIAVVSTLRRDADDRSAFLGALARLHVLGVDVDWGRVVGAGGELPELPTYPFQRSRFWLSAPPATASRGSLGHELLLDRVELAHGAGSVALGRCSVERQAWLADHVVLGETVVPGVAVLELVCAAAGAGAVVDELVLQRPMVVPDDGALDLQVSVGALLDGCASVEVSARSADAGGEWERYASGSVGVAVDAPGSSGPLVQWPPVDGRPVDIEGLYERLSGLGVDYGPAFQGLRGVWAGDDVVYAEVEVPASLTGSAFAPVHPAVVDAAFHALFAAAPEDFADLQLPYSLQRSWWASDGPARSLVRAVLTRVSPGKFTVLLVDADGLPLLRVEELALRPVDRALVRNPRQDLLCVDWEPLADSDLPEQSSPGNYALLSPPSPGAAQSGTQFQGWPALDKISSLENLDQPPAAVLLLPSQHEHLDVHDPESARVSTMTALTLLQDWLNLPSSSSTLLVFCTERAIAASSDEDVPNLAHAPLWGLLRTAQTEYPGRFAIIDTDDEPESHALLSATLDYLLRNPDAQVVIRTGKAHTPNLTALQTAARPTSNLSLVAPEKEVCLIFGGGGAIGRALLKRLSQGNSYSHIVLANRTQRNSQSGKAETADTGRPVDVISRIVDITDEDAVRSLFKEASGLGRIRTVYNLAGVLRDTLLVNLDEEDVTAVLAPKVKGSWHLLDIAEGYGAEELVLFSSAASVIGVSGQAAYSAANAYMGALAHFGTAHRSIRVTTIDWGVWKLDNGMADAIPEEARRELVRRGVQPLSEHEALDMLETAMSMGVVQVTAGLQNIPRPNASGSTRSRRPVADTRPERRLEQVVDREQLVQLVQDTVRTVLKRERFDDPDMNFRDMGFNSITAVEFRNKLSDVLNLRLSATLVYDRPTINDVVGHLEMTIRKEMCRDMEQEMRALVRRLSVLSKAAGSIDAELAEELSGALEPVLASLPAARRKNHAPTGGSTHDSTGSSLLSDEEAIRYILGTTQPIDR